MKMKQAAVVTMMAVVAAGVMGCSSGGASETAVSSAETGVSEQAETSQESTEEIKLTMMNSKPELEDALEAAAERYKEITGVEIEIYTTDKPGEGIAQKYAAGDPANLMICDYSNVTDIAVEKLVDLTEEKWMKDGGELLGVKVDGKTYGFPFCVEATGILYNKNAIENIIGKEFVPEEYTSLDSFRTLLETLRAGGMEDPMILNSEDWSIGQHALQYHYRMQTGKKEDGLKLFEEIKAGNTSFAENKVFNSVFDTFDVFKEYNINKKDPLAADYDLNASYLAEGEAAFWMNGSWAWPDTKEYVDGTMTYGIMPFPVNGDFPSVGQLNANATKFIAIDRLKASEDEQEASKAFLDWLVYDEVGQDVLVNECEVVPAFKNISQEMTNDFNIGVKSYVDQGKVNEYVPIPADHRSSLAAYMQKYLAGELDRKEMAQYMDEYFKAH